MRIGARKQPFYRVVVIDERSKRNGAYLELLGTYNPLTEPKEIKLKQDRIDEWVKKGAQFSDGFLRIIGKAPQRPPRKPKKEKNKQSTVSSQLVTEPENQEVSSVLTENSAAAPENPATDDSAENKEPVQE